MTNIRSTPVLVVDTQASLPMNVQVGEIAYCMDTKAFCSFNGTNWMFNDSLIFSQTATKTIANTAAETSALGIGIGSQILKANSFQPGKRLRIHGDGIYSTPLALTTSLLIKVKIGSVTIATVTTTSLLVGGTNKSFTVDVLAVCQSAGATGKVICGGTAEYATSVGTRVFDDLDNAGAQSTIDTTVDNTVDVTVQWNLASASRTMSVNIATIMLV